tara:strand:- start:17803 stop:18381 length:579 start_codon:yes stop_codon:yes gene_type:complete
MHLINNLALFVGPEVFNKMVATLESIKPIIRVMEAGLLIILLMHIGNALQLTFKNRKASNSKSSNNQTSTLNSRTMAVSGTIVLLFFIIHLRYIWYTYQAHLFIDETETYYDVLLRNDWGYLGHTPTAVFYVLAIMFIAFHIKHGFQSALKTFGVLKQSRIGLLYGLSFIFWGFIPAMFIVIIISIQAGIIN